MDVIAGAKDDDGKGYDNFPTLVPTFCCCVPIREDRFADCKERFDKAFGPVEDKDALVEGIEGLLGSLDDCVELLPVG